MSIWLLYFIALLPLLLGGVWVIYDNKINLAEYITGSILAFVLAGIMHLVAIHGMTDDIETWSGQITHARHNARWKEYYEYAVYRTEVYTTTSRDSKGRSTTNLRTRQVFDHWEPANKWHNDSYQSYSNISTSYNIDGPMYNHFVKVFNDNHSIKGHRTTSSHNSRMIDGDPNDYIADNKTGWVQPITDLKTFENRIKGAPTTFSFIKVPKDIKVFPYPENKDPWHSDRLIGSANLLDKLSFDQLNARLGPQKKANIIMVGMGNVDSSYANWQEAAWLRGKKNDIVICWGGLNKSPSWAKVFSWGEGLALKNIETIVLEHGVTNEVLPEIEKEVLTNFTRADFKKFSYIEIEVPNRYLWWYLGFMVFIQGGFWVFAKLNSCDKDFNIKNKKTYLSNHVSWR